MARVKIEIEADDPLVDRMELREISEEMVLELIRAVIWVFSEGFMKELGKDGRYEGFVDAARKYGGAEIGARDGDGPRLAFSKGVEDFLEGMKRTREREKADDNGED